MSTTPTKTPTKLLFIQRVILASTIFSLASSCSSSLDSGTSYSTSQTTTATLNQHSVHKNACGPCAIVIALNQAASPFRSTLNSSQSLQQQADLITKQSAKTGSSHYTKMPRWSSRKGMRSLDLKDILSEQSGKQFSLSDSAINDDETELQMLKRNHKTMVQSMQKGFPPVLSLKFHIYRKFNAQDGYYWIKTKGHYVVLQSVSKKLAKNADSFNFRYIDPYDGLMHTGTVYAKPKRLLTTSPILRQKDMRAAVGLTADLPTLKIANGDVPSGGEQTLVIDAIIGAM